MRHDNIHIRPGRTDDLPAIGRIVVQSWQHTFRGLISDDHLDKMSDDHQRQRHERMFAREAMVYRVATGENGAVTGFCSGGPSRLTGYDAQNEIYAIYLVPGCERQGIGRRLFENVAMELGMSGRTGLVLTALSINPNRSFYTRIGGVEVAANDLQIGDRTYQQAAFTWAKAPRPN